MARGKYSHGLALNPRAEALSEAFLRLNGKEALMVLLDLHRQGMSIDDIEHSTLEPAITKVGELWLRGRVEDARFDQFGALAESVERHFRMVITVPGAMPGY